MSRRRPSDTPRIDPLDPGSADEARDTRPVGRRLAPSIETAPHAPEVVEVSSPPASVEGQPREDADRARPAPARPRRFVRSEPPAEEPRPDPVPAAPAPAPEERPAAAPAARRLAEDGDPFADHISSPPPEDPFTARIREGAPTVTTRPARRFDPPAPRRRPASPEPVSSSYVPGGPEGRRVAEPAPPASEPARRPERASRVDAGPEEPAHRPARGWRGRDRDHWSPVRVFARARRRKGRRPVRRAIAAVRRRPRGPLAIAAVGLLALLGLSAPPQAPLHGFLPDSPSGEEAAAVPPTAFAREEIPPLYLSLYVRFGEEENVDWRLLAAIGWTESNHGRDPASRVVNSSGCVGPMQLGVGGACGDFVAAWGADGNGDGEIDPSNPADAIATAARGLREGKGAPPPGGSWEAHRTSACRYYGACSEEGIDYAERVMSRAARYGLAA